MPITHAFVSAKSDGEDPTQVQPSNWNEDHVGSPEWDYVIVKPANQSVTGTSVYADDTDFMFAVTAGSTWRVELALLYIGTDVSADFSCRWAVSTGTMYGIFRFFGWATNDTNAAISTVINNLAAAGPGPLGVNTARSRQCLIEGMFQFTNAATFKFQFAEAFGITSTSATVVAGSILKAKRLV